MNLFSSCNNELAGRFEFADVAHFEMDDTALASLFAANNLEHSMTLDAVNATAAATTANRRFRTVRGRSTNFLGFEDVSFKRVHGRFGGDVGNRKRREETRHEDDIEHAIRVRVSKREGREAIEFGVAEYESIRRQALAAARRNAAAAGTSTLHAFDGTPLPVSPGMLVNGRTGALVEVVRKHRRAIKKSALATTASAAATSRPRLTSDQVRAKLGLPAKQ